MNYRPEIDGLRAVAVLAVLFYHAGLAGFSGGYVGVDVFFVISGYLITRLLALDLSQKRFSLKKFYERRCRRILPALFIMCLSVSLAAWFLFLPFEFKNFGRSLAATATFWANILFWRQTGYFDAESFTKPLLHCWSLAVEEQFYIFFPLLLAFLHRKTGRRLWSALAFLALLSLALSAGQVLSRPETAFYFLPSRAWELLLGSLAALWPYAPTPARLIEPLAGFSLFLILAPFFLYGASTPFPGLAAAPPVFGAALFIHVHQAGLALSRPGRWLAAAPLRNLGKISYSLYLWHWPLLSIPRYLRQEPLSPAARLAALAGAFLLAWLSWRFIENPVRQRRLLKSGRAVLAASLAGILCLTAAGRLVRSADGFPSRLTGQARLYAEAAEDSYRIGASRLFSPYEVRAWPLGPESREPGFLVWGDSHANMWRAGLDLLAEEYQSPGLFIDPRGCGFLMADQPEPETGRNCGGYREAVLEMIREKGFREVLLAMRYSVFFGVGPFPERPPAYEAGSALAAGRNEFERRLKYTLRRLNEAGARVWLIENVPEYPDNVVNRLAFGAQRGLTPEEMGYPRRHYRNRNAEARRILSELSGPGFRLLPVDQIICRGGRCLPGDRKSSFYTDAHHLTNYGAVSFRSAIRPLFRAIEEERNKSRPAG
ncbi:MAG: acyltransferase [Candidatus Adiutrix sp.]|jgi:peptidoglycan/LPS O-acetylase OafA/YrhL|nr:acyltransferase [Candidatus Adiutrix sp.]